MAARCLDRGLAVLSELNRRRMAGAAEIGAAIGVPRPTVHRLLLALTAGGYARRLDGSEYFVPQAAVTVLAAGWDMTARAVEVAIERVNAVAVAADWPIDLTVFDRDAMVVRHSTHDQVGWSLLPRSPVGRRLPLIGTAPGRMYLAGLAAPERARLSDEAGSEEDAAIAAAARQGYAIRDGGLLPRTRSIAVPVRRDGATLLCVSMAFIRASTTLDEVVAAHLPTLRAIAARTQDALAQPAAGR